MVNDYKHDLKVVDNCWLAKQKTENSIYIYVIYNYKFVYKSKLFKSSLQRNTRNIHTPHIILKSPVNKTFEYIFSFFHQQLFGCYLFIDVKCLKQPFDQVKTTRLGFYYLCMTFCTIYISWRLLQEYCFKSFY